MKKSNLRNILASVFAIFIVTILITGCGKKESGEVSGDSKKSETTTGNKETNQTKEMAGSEGTEHIMVTVSTMQCGMCKKNIETAVNKLDGIESINVDKKEKVAHINFDKNKVDLAKIEVAITSAGYDANDKKADPKAYSELDDCCKLPEDQKK